MPHAAQPDHPDITEQMWSQIQAVIAENRDKPGSIITVLRECQDIVGYLPVALMDYISAGMNLPSSEVFGVASFYALFSMEPEGAAPDQAVHGDRLLCEGYQRVSGAH